MGRPGVRPHGTHGGDLRAAQLLQLRGRRRAADCASQASAWLLSSTGVEVSPQALLAVQQPIARSLLPGAKPIDGARQLLEYCRDHSVPAAMVTSSSVDAASIKIGPPPVDRSVAAAPGARGRSGTQRWQTRSRPLPARRAATWCGAGSMLVLRRLYWQGRGRRRQPAAGSWFCSMGICHPRVFPIRLPDRALTHGGAG